MAYDPDEKVFYIIANKYNETLGFYVLKIKETTPEDMMFLIKWETKLDIGDAQI